MTNSMLGQLRDVNQTFDTIFNPGKCPEISQLSDRSVDQLTNVILAAPAEFGIELEVAIALAETGEVIRADENIIFSQVAFEDIKRRVLEQIDQTGSISLAQFRDHFGSSRKYAQAVLEYLDQQRITRRVGDERIRY